METKSTAKKGNGELPEGVTAEMIAEWKEKYGEDNIRLKELYKEGSSEPVRVITRVPSVKIVSEYMKHIDKDFNKATGIMVANCLLTEKEKIKGDPELFLTCGKAISDDIPLGRVESKKL